MTQLIQLNSTLAYVVSQISYGAIPILERPCLISSHSLLGIGTAYRGVAAIAGFVEDTFESTPVLAVIDERYRQWPGVAIEKNVPEYQIKLWSSLNPPIDIDSHLKGVSREPGRPKLAYFSSRLGFGEAHFSITSATQVLHAADSGRWSLVTLTHELLHSHVTGLLATILSDSEKSGVTPEAFRRYHADFIRCVRDDTDPATLLESLRFVLFSFAAGRHSALTALHRKENSGSEEHSIVFDVALPTEADLFGSFFRTSLRLLEEIFVHTLDLHYFYNGDCDLFLEVLWESWTTVPAVVGDLEQYVLRSLVAIATTDKSPNRTVDQRLHTAIEALTVKITELINGSESNLFLRKTLFYLQSEEKLQRIRLLFTPCIYLADMVAKFLYSASVQARFWSGDKNIDSSEGRSEYLMETLSFSGGKVENPVAFLMSRVRTSREDTSHFDEDYRSAWVLVATASAARF